MSKTKTLKRQRYRPVSEFDEATLASKREYWRTKKREQRAKLAKKKTKTPNTRICKPGLTGSSFTERPQAKIGPSLLSNRSHQTDVAKNVGSSYYVSPKINIKTDIKDRFEKTKSKVACEPLKSTIDSKKCMLMCKEEVKIMTTEDLNMDASVVKINGSSFPKGTVTSTCPTVLTNSKEPRQMRKGLSAFNGNLSAISQQSAISEHTPEFHKQDHIKIQSFVTPRSSAIVECKVSKVQDILGRRSANSNRKACEYVPECSSALDRSSLVSMTEEEKAAKRREIWRIKKRQQRAKRAEKLKKDGERMQCFKKGQQESGKLSHVVTTCALSPVNTMALRGCKPRNSAMSIGSTQNEIKPVPITVRVNRHVTPSYKQPTRKQQVVLKVGDTHGALTRNHSLVSTTRFNHLQNSKHNFMSVSSRVSQPSICVPRATVQSNVQHTKFMPTRRRRALPQAFGRMETTEEWHAKQREYWRIKKREQRARLSSEVKARLKERDAIKRHAMRYQNVLDQKRKTVVGFPSVQQPNKAKLTSASQSICGFIKEDGTITVSTSDAPSTMISPAGGCGTALRRASYPTAPTVLKNQMLGRVGIRPALKSIPDSCEQLVNISQRSIGQDISTSDSLVESNVSSSAADDKDIQGCTYASQTKELNLENTVTFKREEESYDSSLSCNPISMSAPHCSIKQEPSDHTIDHTCSLTEQSVEFKDIKPPPSPLPQTKTEEEPSLISDNQATTLLVVASMKRLLEESLTSVGEGSSSLEGGDDILPCQTKDEPFPLEETDLPAHVALKCDVSGDASPSIEVKLSPGLCHSPPQAPDFSTEDTVFSHKESSIQLPSTVTNKRAFFSQGLGCGWNDQSVPAVQVQNPLQRDNQSHSCRATGPQLCCPRQACGVQQLNESSELQRKREYWRLMKRQQRARKAKDKERSCDTFQHNTPCQPMQNICSSCQAYCPSLANSVSNPGVRSNTLPPPAASHHIRLTLRPVASTNQQPSNAGRKLLLPGKPLCSGAPQVNNQQIHRCTSNTSTRPDTVTLTQMNHVKLSGHQTQAGGSLMPMLKNNQSHLKANEELDPEEVIRRRRMHWRIKKQEQRARKAARERELSHPVTLNHVEPNTPTRTAELVQSTPPETLDYLSEQCQTMPFKDDADLFFAPDYEISDEPLSESQWRSTYLMDYDPVNQLLVCMVCGEQQYCLSVEGVRAHIEEAHPGTLTLNERECQGILEAWDEQVAMRERFFSNQLWQNSDVLKEQSLKPTAEVEVTLEMDDIKQNIM